MAGATAAAARTYLLFAAAPTNTLPGWKNPWHSRKLVGVHTAAAAAAGVVAAAVAEAAAAVGAAHQMLLMARGSPRSACSSSNKNTPAQCKYNTSRATRSSRRAATGGAARHT